MDRGSFVLKISLVIAAFEEGPDLEATVALAIASQPEPHEIIVVDDQSTQPLEARLAAFPSVKVYRTPERLGAGPAKSYGANRAEGDLIVLMDSHLRFSQDWLRFVADAFSRYPDAIMCPVSTGFEQDFTFAGAGEIQPARKSRDGFVLVGRSREGTDRSGPGGFGRMLFHPPEDLEIAGAA